jgi:hypothetical protein
MQFYKANKDLGALAIAEMEKILPQPSDPKTNTWGLDDYNNFNQNSEAGERARTRFAAMMLGYRVYFHKDPISGKLVSAFALTGWFENLPIYRTFAFGGGAGMNPPQVPGQPPNFGYTSGKAAQAPNFTVDYSAAHGMTNGYPTGFNPGQSAGLVGGLAYWASVLVHEATHVRGGGGVPGHPGGEKPGWIPTSTHDIAQAAAFGVKERAVWAQIDSAGLLQDLTDGPTGVLKRLVQEYCTTNKWGFGHKITDIPEYIRNAINGK